MASRTAFRTSRLALVCGAVAVSAAFAFGCGDADDEKGDTSTGTATDVLAKPSDEEIDNLFFLTLTNSLIKGGTASEVAECVGDVLKEIATREELDAVEAGGHSVSLAKKTDAALIRCAAK